MKLFRLQVLAALAAGCAKLSAALLVNLDATNLPAGQLPVWDNLVDTNPINDFTRNGTSVTGVYVAPGPVPVSAVLLNGTTDFYVGPEAPPGVTGNSQRTIEAWVFNPIVGSEEDMFGWGRRGGPDASNMTFGFGTHTSWGAVGHWASAYDMDWQGSPSAAAWHYLVYTHDGVIARVYADGEQRNARPMTLITNYRSPAAARLKFLVGAQNDPDGNPVSYGSTLFLAKVRVHTTALTAQQVREAYNAEAALFGRTPLTGVAPGSVDPAFNPNTTAQVIGMAEQPDGRIVLGGGFMFMNGNPSPFIGRVRPDDTLEPGFGPAVDDSVQSIAVQPDGRVVIAGFFTAMGGAGRGYIARINPDGTADNSFVASANDDTRHMMLTNDGRMVVAGSFTQMNGEARNYIARLNADGSLDNTFNPAPGDVVRATLVQPDGKIIIAGAFSTAGGSARNRIARVLPGGALDSAFNPNVTGAGIYSLGHQADGKVIVGGNFTAVSGSPRTNMARLNADGTLDGAFTTTANNIVRSVAVQTDGRIIISGNFTAVNGVTRNRVARLNADGTLDNGFIADADQIVFGAMILENGKVVIGGDLTNVGGVARNRSARLENDAATQALTVTGPARVQWLRGGASPETHAVTFELSTDGGASWAPLGSGTRISGGWELTGLSLPAAGLLRARARIVCGYGNGSSGIVETTVAYTPLQMWRYAHFGTTDSSGPAANSADPDKDGLENLVEYAFALNPNAPDAGALPEWQRDDDNYLLAFTRPANVSGVTYVAEYSSSLAPGSWTQAANAGAGNNFIFVTTATGPRLYLRLRVTVP